MTSHPQSAGLERRKRGSLEAMESKPPEKVAWTSRQDLVIQIASPEVAAEKLGRTVKAILARRVELGLPDPLSGRERMTKKRPQ